MYDQAHTLRRLVRDCVRADAPPPCPRPAVLSVAGAKQGVGTTSLSLNLAVAFQQLGRPAIFVDSPSAANDFALHAGPGGIQILGAGDAGDRGSRPTTTDMADPQWITDVTHLAPTTEVIVIDAGNGPSPVLTSLWEASDVALLVTSTDPASLVGGYTLLKLLYTAAPQPTVYGLVNRVLNAAEAGAAFGRIHRACRRFLALELRPAGFVPNDPSFALALPSGAPIVLGPAGRPARDRLVRTAYALNEALQAARANDFSVISCQERLNLEPRTDRYTRTLSVADQPLNYAD